MPKYYCDYCDAFLTHDSPSVRKTHNGGRKHKENVRHYYQAWMEAQAQKLIDATTKAFTTQRMIAPPPSAIIQTPTMTMGMGDIMPRPFMPPMGMLRPPILPPTTAEAYFPTSLPAGMPLISAPIPSTLATTTMPAENGVPLRTNIKIQPPE